MSTAPAFKTAEHRAGHTRGSRAHLPRFQSVLGEQIRATGFALRRPALLVVALLTMVTVVVALQRARMGVVDGLYEWPTMTPGLIGSLLPIAVWARDERFGPGFMWTLPVDRRVHVFTKVLAGWVWLMVGVAGVAVWLLVLSLVSGGSLLPPGTLNVATAPLPPIGPIDRSSLRAVSWAPGLLIFAVPFAAATVMYLLGSAFALGTRFPLRWVIGVALTYGISGVVSEAAGTQSALGSVAAAPWSGIHGLVEGRYGFDALMTARTATLRTTAFLTTGERAVVWRGVPDLADWRGATLIWTGAGLLALWVAASRHGERRRG